MKAKIAALIMGLVLGVSAFLLSPAHAQSVIILNPVSLTSPNMSFVHYSYVTSGGLPINNTTNITQLGPTMMQFNGTSSAGFTATPEISPMPTVMLSGNASGVGNNNGFTGAQVVGILNLEYQFVVVPNPGVPVGPVTIEVIASGSSTGGSSPQAAFQINNVLTESLTGGSRSWTLDANFSFQANQVYTAYILVEGTASAPGCAGMCTSSESFSAVVDPILIIAPAFASNYTLEFSPGVQNGIPGGVPEPSTWAMMLLGFAGLGFAVRRSRRKAAFA
jgi:hypothetical protein